MMNDNEYPNSTNNNQNNNQNNNGYRDLYTNIYPNDYGQAPKLSQPQYSSAIPPNRDNKPKKAHPIMKKVAACIALGILFGFFTGVSFYAVRAVNNFIESKNSITASTNMEEAAPEGTTGDTAKGSFDQNIAKIPQTDRPDGAATPVVTDVTAVVDNVMPSVVSITNLFTDTQDFFGQTVQSEQTAGGSGIIIGQNEEELLIATNYHVVEKSNELQVQFIDGSETTAQIKGTNNGMDLAVIAVQFDTLSAKTRNSIAIATLGDSDNLKVGEPAIAIGNSLGYGQSVTTGVISAVNRSISDIMSESPENTGIGSESDGSLIQTDAAINPGNSGGALLNMKGEVIGINSNKIGGSIVEGMGYAIPISSAQPIIEDLMTKTTRVKVDENKSGYLGIVGKPIPADVAAAYGMPQGVLVTEVTKGTGAEKAGLVAGDIITKFDGSSVDDMVTLKNMLQYYAAGTEVELTIKQGSPNGWQEKTIKITLSERPDDIDQPK
ncbi:MAG: trypsin-like peptidase domain-containing protein [Lachnospiraceae bacterium]